MEVNWEAIMAVSTAFLTLFTLGLMLATIWLAIIALQAKNTWKDEHKEKKKLELFREINTLLIGIREHLYTVAFETNKDFKGIDAVDEYLSKFRSKLNKLLDFQEELLLVNCESFSNLLLLIIQKGNTSPIFQQACKPVSMPMSWEEERKITISDLLKNCQELTALIDNAQKICYSEIKNFYKVKDK